MAVVLRGFSWVVLWESLDGWAAGEWQRVPGTAEWRWEETPLLPAHSSRGCRRCWRCCRKVLFRRGGIGGFGVQVDRKCQRQEKKGRAEVRRCFHVSMPACRGLGGLRVGIWPDPATNLTLPELTKTVFGAVSMSQAQTNKAATARHIMRPTARYFFILSTAS
jgi:hypothetical protein